MRGRLPACGPLSQRRYSCLRYPSRSVDSGPPLLAHGLRAEPSTHKIAPRSPQADAQSPDRVERMAVREREHLPWGSRNRLGLARARMSQAVMSTSSAPVATVDTLAD